MCHTHRPVSGIDMMRVDYAQNARTVRLSSDDCHFVLDANDLAKVIAHNTWSEDYKSGSRIPRRRLIRPSMKDVIPAAKSTSIGTEIYGDLSESGTCSAVQ